MAKTIIADAVFAHARKHQRLEGFLQQGQRRALKRAGGEAARAKTREIIGAFNVRQTAFSSVRPIRALFKESVSGDTLTERVIGPRGIPLRDFGLRQDRRGLVFSVRRGRLVKLRSGFIIGRIGGHGFTRKGPQRLPIKKRFGPGIPTMADDPEVRKRGAAAFQERVVPELRREEDRAFRRAGL